MIDLGPLPRSKYTGDMTEESTTTTIETSDGQERPGLTVQRYHTKEDTSPYDQVEWELRDASITGADGEVFFEQKGVEVPRSWSQTATNVVVQKYFRAVPGHPDRETSVRQMIGRVADTIANGGRDSSYFKTDADYEAFRAELTHLLLNQKMAFNSPVWFNVGVEDHPQSSACFINSVDDSMEAILGLARTEGTLFKYGSGTGSNLSSLRSSRESLSGGGTASGPVSFMRGFDAFAGAIKSGGKTRRAAKMVILNVNHPDIIEFVDCKVAEEKKAWALIDAGYDGGFNVQGGAYDSVNYQNANHSIRVDDEFMRAVERGDKYNTINVTDGEVCETHDAREIMRRIAEAAHVCGDPGIQFDTIINDWHTSAVSGRINSSNPCCFVGSTLVETSEGDIEISELRRMYDAGEKLPLAVAWDTENNLPVLRQITCAWKAGDAKTIVRVTTDKGVSVECTSDHRFLLRDGSWVEARDLEPGDRLRSDVNDRVLSVEHVSVPETGEPVFDIEVDGVHNFSVTDKDSDHGIIVHNSEYMYLDDSACNLASLNLRKFQRRDGSLDVESYKHAIKITITAMEILVEISSYPTEKIHTNSKLYRPLGLGYANLGALLMSKGYAYDSDEGREYAAAVTSLLCGQAYVASAELAAEATGPFPHYEQNAAPFMRVIRKHQAAWFACLADRDDTVVPEDLAMAAKDAWARAVELGDEYGFRNGQATVLAPTGTIAFLMDCDTTGIEPDIALVKYKRLVGGGLLKIVNQSVTEVLSNLGYTDSQAEAIALYVQERETIEGAPHLKDEHLPVFDCAFRSANGTRSIQYMGHIRMMSAVQPFLSGAISKTVNLPGDCTVQDIEDAYMESWRLGLKAVAVYRDGCKRTQPLSTSAEQATSDGSVKDNMGDLSVDEIKLITAIRASKEKNGPPPSIRRRLPNDRLGITHKFEIAGHEGYLNVGLYENGQPGEMFIRMAKEGSVIAGLMDSFATSISLALQHGVSLESLCNKFRGTRFEPSGFTKNQEIPIATSIMDYVFRYLSIRFLEGEKHPAAMINAEATKEVAADVVETNEPKNTTDAKVTWRAETDAPPCHECGTLMVRNGACHKCPNCGATSGCS